MPRISSHLPAASCALALAAACAMSFASAPRAETMQDTASAKAMLGEILDHVSDLIASSIQGSALKMAGEASALPAGNSVEMIFPDASIVGRVGSDGGGFHLGNVSATVTPQGKDDFEFSISLPKSISILDPTGKSKGRISWSESAMRGIWRADLETATVIHGALYNVLFTDPNQDAKRVAGTIESITLDQELVETANGWWSGPFSFNVANIEFNPPVVAKHYSLEKISLSGEFHNFDLAAWQALSEWENTISIAVDGADPNPFGDGLAAARIFESMNLGAGNMDLSISGLSYGPPGIHQFRMGEFALSVSYDNDARPGAYSLSAVWQGLEQGDSDLPGAFFTHTGSLKMHLEQFPVRQILTLALRQTATLDSPGESENGDALQLMIVPLINANQTGLRLEELVLRSSAASLAATGSLSARNNSALGVVGEAHLEITGLDRLIVAAARQAESGEAAPNLLAFLTMAKGLGQPEIDAEGALVYVFDILMPADGMVKINKIPLELLLDSGLTALPDPETRTTTASAQAPRS